MTRADPRIARAVGKRIRTDSVEVLREDLRAAQGLGGIAFALEQRYLQIIKAMLLRAPGNLLTVTGAELAIAADYRVGMRAVDDHGGVALTVRRGTGGSREDLPGGDAALAERGRL